MCFTSGEFYITLQNVEGCKLWSNTWHWGYERIFIAALDILVDSSTIIFPFNF